VTGPAKGDSGPRGTTTRATREPASTAHLIEHMLEGFAHCRMLLDEQGRPDDFVYLAVNPAFGRLTGLEDVVGRRVTEVLPSVKEQNPELMEIYGGVARTGEPAEFDIDFAPLQKWLHVSASSPGEGEFVAFFYDISARRRLELEQRKALQMLAVAEQASRAGFWEWDITADVQTWTAGYRTLFRLPDDAPASFETWRAVVHRDDVAAAEERIRLAVDTGVLENRYRIVTPDGGIVWIGASGLVERDGDGSPLLMTGLCLDITGQVLAEQELRRSEDRLSRSLAAAHAGTWEWDVETGENLWSDELWELYALDREKYEASYDAWLASVLPEDRAWASSYLAAASSAGLELDFIWRANTPDGSLRWLHSRGSPEVDGGGRVVRYRGVVLDVTSSKETQDTLRRTLDSIGDGVLALDAEWRTILMNAAAERMLEVAFDEVRGRSIWDVARIADTLVEDEFRRAAAGEVREFESFHEPQARWFLNRCFPAAQGGLTVYLTDITERKRAARDLADSETRLRSLFEHSSIGVIITAGDDSVEAANPAVQAMFGYSEDEIKQLRRPGMIDVADPRLATAVRKRELTGRVQAVELTAIRKGGERFPVEVDSTLMPGPPPRALVMLRDISERKQAERALAAREAEARETLERLSRAQAVGHMGDWSWEVESGVVTWSPEVYRIFGVGPEFETTFDTIMAMVHKDDRAAHLARVERLSADAPRSSGQLNFRVVRPDGDVRDVFQTIAVERDDHGAPVRMYGIMQDVTELRRTEQALVASEARLRRLNLELEDRVEERTQQLKKANEELESFSYSVSHDLRAPLRHISGYSHLLAEQLGGDLDEEAQHFLDTIVRSARQMGDLIDDLLQFSRLGRAELHVTDVDMTQCAEEALAQIPEEASVRTKVLIRDLPAARGDRILLRQVWANLLDNACKYSATRDAPEVEVGARAEPGEAVFWVRDNGVGFDMTYAAQLFNVFQRLHSEKEFEGTGIGLANVRRIVERHGGRVWAEAAPDAGATFFFGLPGA
jgi:PAS domain S-box-containing protein